MMCKHEDKTCLKLKWGETEYSTKRSDGLEVTAGSANVDLWYCLTCDSYILKDWHTGEYTDGFNEKIVK